jgi:hypothetical protein
MKQKIIGILLTGLLFIACDKDEGHYLEKDRIPILIVGDSILFKSNTNRIDSFLVSNVDRKEHYSDKVFTSEYYRVLYNKLNDTCTSENPYNCDFYRVFIDWDRSSVLWRNFSEECMSHSPSTNIEINGVVYQKVYKISTDTTNLKQDDVIKVFFSDQQGVLGYELKSGEYFERIK